MRRELFPQRPEWLMLTLLRRFFLHEDFLVTRLSSSECVLNQYHHVLDCLPRGLNISIGFYNGALSSIMDAPVLAGFAIMPM